MVRSVGEVEMLREGEGNEEDAVLLGISTQTDAHPVRRRRWCAFRSCMLCVLCVACVGSIVILTAPVFITTRFGNLPLVSDPDGWMPVNRTTFVWQNGSVLERSSVFVSTLRSGVATLKTHELSWQPVVLRPPPPPTATARRRRWPPPPLAPPPPADPPLDLPPGPSVSPPPWPSPWPPPLPPPPLHPPLEALDAAGLWDV
jgi:hypothetical protein